MNASTSKIFVPIITIITFNNCLLLLIVMHLKTEQNTFAGFESKKTKHESKICKCANSSMK